MPETETAVPVAPTPDPVPAPEVSAPVSGDISALAQPGASLIPGQAAPSPMGTSDYGVAVSNEQAALQGATKTAAESTAPPPPGPHARLLAMVHGLAIGLGAAATSMGTGGREGGAKEVAQIQGEEQQQKIQAQQAREAQKNTKIQQQLMVADTNHKLAQTVLLNATMPNEIAKSDLEVSGARQAQAITGADFQAAHGGMTAEQFSAALAGTGPATAQGGAAGSFFITSAQQQLGAAEKILGSDDPYVAKLQTALNDPKATPKDLWTATSQVQNQLTIQEKATQAQTQKHAADPLYKLESDPNEMTGDKAPAAVSMLTAKLADPTLPADQKPRVQRLLDMANLATKNALAFKEAEEKQKQMITDGDPKAAGSLLQSGLVSPQELISSRKPQFAQQAFDEAIRLGGGVKGPDGKWTGGTWSAVKAEAQYEYAKNPKTQNTLNLLTTMQAPNGSIDIAQKMFNTIPGKIDEKTFNKIMTGVQTEFGGVSTVDFKAAMVSLADEYAQVLQGGAATETTLQQAKDLIQQAYTKEQGAGAFDTIRLDMAARQKGMVRDNPALMQMYPEMKSPTGKVVSLKAAMALPVNAGKTEAQVRADIAAHGHQVGQ